MRGRLVRKMDLAGGGEPATRVTRCKGSWLEAEPSAAEQRRIAEAQSRLREQRAEAQAFHEDADEANAFCIELFRDERFGPMHFADPLVEKIIAKVGEPPVVDEGEEAIFSDYLRRAVLSVALPNTRRLLAAQLRRYLPAYVEQGQWKEAAAIDYSAFRTALGEEVTPFLAQMALAGLADYYDTHEEEPEEGEPETAEQP
jgi:hypothetical protein